jgi:hypothetical protein
VMENEIFRLTGFSIFDDWGGSIPATTCFKDREPWVTQNRQAFVFLCLIDIIDEYNKPLWCQNDVNQDIHLMTEERISCHSSFFSPCVDLLGSSGFQGGNMWKQPTHWKEVINNPKQNHQNQLIDQRGRPLGSATGIHCGLFAFMCV